MTDMLLVYITCESVKQYEALEAEVIKIHPYDTPCIIAIPVKHVGKNIITGSKVN